LILDHKCRDDGKNGRRSRRKVQQAQEAAFSAIADAPGNTDTSRDGQALEGPPPPPGTFLFVDELAGTAPAFKDYMKTRAALNNESFPYMPPTYPGTHVSAPVSF
jgi:hypothetical protein